MPMDTANRVRECARLANACDAVLVGVSPANRVFVFAAMLAEMLVDHSECMRDPALESFVRLTRMHVLRADEWKAVRLAVRS